ncbi:MAG: Magnesium transport protein CorA [uncultured Campylobacterales bacterium]|uniref:Magnesium transport protein CorA n=1 Tax=uncultured Campylobacterales bacterium TaxID=352960 RepID=A0A6S6S6K5_9BACT|nr:MAG: Magnesium transport protein CorA [uncultured Campylobacterales bacterium]
MKEFNPKVTSVNYSPLNIEIKDFEDYELFEKTSINENINSWIHIDPIDNKDAITRITSEYGVHSLIVEDVFSMSHRPKAEEFELYLFTLLKHVEYKNQELYFSQISFILGQKQLFSFGNGLPTRFETIKNRLNKKDSKIRKEGIDYLLLMLIDCIVDNYFIALEAIDEDIQNLEFEILSNPMKKNIQDIYRLKRILIDLKKNIWPMRELMNVLLKSDMIDYKYHIYGKDIYDHIIKSIDIIEGYGDSVSSLLDVYSSTLNTHMNETMKRLSIISTIFIPLSFITGYFGMNFKHQNTVLESQDIYYLSNGLMFLIPVVLFIFFKMKKW